MVFDAFNEICCVAYLTLSGTEDKAESVSKTNKKPYFLEIFIKISNFFF